MGAEEHLVRAFKAIEVFEPQHVVVDAISSCERMGTEQAAFEYAMRLLNACKEQGITTIFVNQTAGFQNETDVSGIGISSMVDTLIFLRFIEIGGEINRLLLVAKMRGSKHSNQYREFLISDEGIDVMDVYVGAGGMLTGAARQEQEARDTIERRLKQTEIERQKREVAGKRAVMEAETVRLQAEVEAAEIELESLRLEQRRVEVGLDARGKMRGEDANSERLVARDDEGEGGAE
ncbi:MAG: hypothetical protein ISS49_02115 [Anaerolineae bacterium]|nr:hypothetical protein [Anaerolineae bacterium]